MGGGGEGSLYSCTLVLCSLATVMSWIDALVQKVTKSPKVVQSTYILQLSGVGRCGWGGLQADSAEFFLSSF
jgi:hypothetical protein